MSFLDEIKSVEAFRAAPRARRNLVFYSEGPEYWPHFQPVIQSILKTHRYPVTYLASNKNDPGLSLSTPLATSFYIGDGGPRAELFRTLDADLMVMTTPDLEALELKRSERCRHYAYIFHSPVSTHMIYRTDAFDHYDSIFCVGPHHEDEIRKREALFGKNAKQLIQHGYGRLDTIIEAAPNSSAAALNDPIKVVVAPSWGPHSVFETVGIDLIDRLLAAGIDVIARPHPQTLRLAKKKIAELESRFGEASNFLIEKSVASADSLVQSDVMISDWSGAALDYAFGLLKPVIFIDTPRKVNNPEYTELEIEPLEADIREEIGRVVKLSDLEGVVDSIRTLAGDREQWRSRLLAAREKWIFNIGESGERGAVHLVRMASSFNAGESDDQEKNAPALNQIVRQIANQLSHDAQSNDDGDIVSWAINRLHDEEETSLSDLKRFDAICRRIDVFKKLGLKYNQNFSKLLDKTPAPFEVFFILAFLLTQNATLLAERNDKGLALKFLNTAGNALNIYMKSGGALGVPHLESQIYKTYSALGLAV